MRRPPGGSLAVKLLPRERKFVDTFIKTGCRITAYKEAGYAWVVDEKGRPKHWVKAAIVLVLKRPRVAAAIEAAHEARALQREAGKTFSIDWLRMKHKRFVRECVVAGDYTNATRNLEALGRTIGAYSDSVQVDVTARRQYSEAEQLEARRLAGLLLDAKAREAVSGNQGQLPMVEGEAVAGAVAADAQARVPAGTGAAGGGLLVNPDLSQSDTPALQRTVPVDDGDSDHALALVESSPIFFPVVDPPSPPTGPGIVNDSSPPTCNPL